MISKSLNGIYENPTAKDKNCKSVRPSCRSSTKITKHTGREGGREKGDETLHCPVKTVDHHPDYCVIGTES